MRQSDILLISYQFCPKGLVGTRRWSKFSKFLTNQGHVVHVVSAKYPYRDKVNWCKDVENNSRIKINRINAMYPSFLLSPKRSFWVKIADAILRNTFYALDAAELWRRPLLRRASLLISKHDIKTVIVTGAPFSQFFFGSLLKKKYPSVKLVLDFRDPWIDIKPHVWFLKKYKIKKAIEWQKKSLQAADIVLFVSHYFQQKYLTGKYGKLLKHKSFILENGYDSADYSEVLLDNDTSHLRIIYTGRLLEGRIKLMSLLAEALSTIDDPWISNNLKVDIYTPKHKAPNFRNESIKKSFEKYFTIHPPLDPLDVITEIQKSDVCLSIIPPEKYFAMGTKVFDYMGAQRSIFQIGPENGELYQILEKEGHYVSTYELDSIKKKILEIKDGYLKGELFINTPSQKFNFSNLTNKLLDIISTE